MNYSEEKSVSKKYKEEYLDGIIKLIEKRQSESAKIRENYTKNIFDNPEKYRSDFKAMLGWPLVNYEDDHEVKIESEKLSAEDGYTVYRMRFEILEGLIMTGLFFKQDGEKPLVICQHGGLGSPEIASGVYGDTTNYNDMVQRVLKKGVHVFAPQLLLWCNDTVNEYDLYFNRGILDAQLKRVGSSITAIEVFGIMKILDYFETQEYVSSFGMVGLSYGGFYTLFTSTIDTRIKSAVSCSFFNTRDAYRWTDWMWFNSAALFDDAEVAALVYPRKLFIEIGNKDELFDYHNGIASFEKLRNMLDKAGKECHAELIVFDGTHEFCKDDTPIDKMVEELSGI